MDDPLIVLPQQHHSNGLRHKRTLAIEKALDIFLINVWRKNIGDDDAGQDKCDWWKIEPLTTRGRATEGWVIVSIFRIFCSNFAFQAFKLGFQYFRRVFYTLQPNNCVFTFNIMHWRFCYGWFSITVFLSQPVFASVIIGKWAPGMVYRAMGSFVFFNRGLHKKWSKYKSEI